MARFNGITQFLPATHTTILTLLRKHSPDGTTQTRRHTSGIAYYSIYRLLKDERLSWPSWLTYSGRLTHISGHPSAAGRAWDRKVRRSKINVLTTVPRNQPETQPSSLHRITSTKFTLLSRFINQSINQSISKSINQFIEQNHRSATYIDMREIHVEIV